MRKYMIDQTLLLGIGICIMIGIPIVCGPVFTFVLEGMTMLSFGYLCRRILAIPFDILRGKETRIVYFASQRGIEDYEFYKDKHCREWKFYYSGDKTISLLVPEPATLEEIHSMKRPKADERVKITYLRYAKILLSWESL